MKTQTKLQLVTDWRTERDIAQDEILTDDHLDDMWSFAQGNQNVYPGVREYCLDFNESSLAKLTRRAKMRSLLEIKIAPVQDAGSIPGAGATKTIAVPQYIGVGTRRSGSQMVPMFDADGTVTADGARMMIEQALKQMEGHKTRYSDFLPAATMKKLEAYVQALAREADKLAVRSAAA